jgi:FSR family fosmidomycin resistance protein-like MFS transporter
VKTAPIKLSKGLAAASLLLIAVVFLRSYSGLSIHFEWAKEGVWGLMLVLAVVLGKAAGGFLLDRFGAITVSAVSLLLAAAGFLVSSGPVFGILSVLLFNMTMPVTLWALARAMPGFKGLSFGLLTFALFIGYLMLWLGLPLASTNSMYALIL